MNTSSAHANQKQWLNVNGVRYNLGLVKFWFIQMHKSYEDSTDYPYIVLIWINNNPVDSSTKYREYIKITQDIAAQMGLPDEEINALLPKDAV